MGIRETQKNVRRQAILDAARTLIREGKGDDFSMPDLAEKAGVSLVTPYNLFGSKSDILLEIARQDIFERAAEIDRLKCEQLPEWISDLATTLARVYYRNRHFYRRMIVTLTAQESAAGQRESSELSYGMFTPSIVRLQERGLLLSPLPASMIAQNLSHGVSGALQHRLMERGSEEGLRRDIEIAIILVLAGLCGAADRTVLLTRLEELGRAGL